MSSHKTIKTVLLALAAAGGLTLLAGLGALKRADRAAEDTLYQHRTASDGEIVLVGIDQRALTQFGPYGQWSRDIIAQAIEALNQAEDSRPAVIGVDVLFAGETQPGPDSRLVQAAGRYGNVISACAAEFGAALTELDGEYYLEDFSIRAFDQPFAGLAQVTEQGHINAMLDSDGILRHHLLAFRLPDGTQVPSLALAAANRYRSVKGLPPVTLPPTDARGFWYLPFCGLPGDFDQAISVADLLSGQADPARFAGKIVLIGPYAAGLQDSYVTAADHARPMYGVEFQANAIQALLWGTYPSEVEDEPQLAGLFLLLLAGLAGFWRRKVRWATLLWLALSGGWVLLCWGLAQAGWLLHVLWAPAGVTVLYAGCLAFNYIQAALERQKVTRTFKRYVAPEIVDELLKAPDALELEGVLADIAVLFVDIRGFTRLSEQLTPRQVVGYLNRCLGFLSKCILDHGGTLDKFVGDEAIAFWGAPLKTEDPAMCAVRAAADMIAGMEALSKQLEEQFCCPVKYRVSIHLGKAVVGNVGSAQHMDYTAIGDTVNTASRLQSTQYEKEEDIYLTREVADALKGRIECRSLGFHALKNKAQSIEVFALDRICTSPAADT